MTLLGRMLQLSPQPGQSDVTILPCFAKKAKEFNSSQVANLTCYDEIQRYRLNMLLVSIAVENKTKSPVYFRLTWGWADAHRRL